jgi:hypothetical protein
MSRAGVRHDRTGRGRLKDDDFMADVIIEPDEFVTVRADVDEPVDLFAALERSGRLPANARFSLCRAGWRLAAETRVNGVAHLPDSLHEIRLAFRCGLTGRAEKPNPVHEDPDPATAIHRTVKEFGWSEEQIVEVDGGWELQPRWAGATVPVELRVAGDDANICCTVLPSLPADDTVVAAVAHQAFLFNARLRCARLAVVQGKLIAETRLRSALIDASWLAFTARAVAAAAQAVTTTMTLVAQEATVAKHYTEVVLKK